jgi:hypothetical protein
LLSFIMDLEWSDGCASSIAGWEWDSVRLVAADAAYLDRVLQFYVLRGCGGFSLNWER